MPETRRAFLLAAIRTSAEPWTAGRAAELYLADGRWAHHRNTARQDLRALARRGDLSARRSAAGRRSYVLADPPPGLSTPRTADLSDDLAALICPAASTTATSQEDPMTPGTYEQKAVGLAQQAILQPQSADAPILAAVAQVYATLHLAAPDQFIYRAEDQRVGLILGHFTTLCAAMRCCEAREKSQLPDDQAVLFIWIGDESEAGEPWELTAQCDGDEQPTGLTVVPVLVTADYDEEADA
ncbi:hypothetical protein [Streptomyces sp. CAU 1734]|uniref:hypothetical protein n=1 Tax=Streptomyces sp. CAU 1734 TaxID=3140360 RepID=UPI003260C79C